MMADKIAGGVLIHAVFNESDGSKPGNLPSNPQSLGFVYSTGVARSGDTNYEFLGSKRPEQRSKRPTQCSKRPKQGSKRPKQGSKS